MNARRRLILGALAAGLLPRGAAAQGFAGLGAAADDYAQVVPGKRFVFPADHGPHPGFRIEWWYLTATLDGPDGAPMGLQWTLFRQATTPGGAQGDGWQSNQIWMAHAAVTTPDRHLLAERFARGGIGQAGVTADPFDAWLDDWRMTGGSGAAALDRLNVSAAGQRFAYRVDLTASGPLVLHGQDGVSVKSPAGQASYYYSQPHFELTGEVVLDGQALPVTGQGWLDREWSSQPLTGDQTGWDWFALRFADGAKLMAYRLRETGGPGYLPGTWIAPDGTAEPLPDGAIAAEPLDWSEVAGRRIPTRWRLRLAARGVDVAVAAVNPQSFMSTVFPYWEGPVSVSGSHPGRGYVEMTGY